MLTSGGLMQQPHLLWFSAQHARWCWDVLDRKYKDPDTELSAVELEFWNKAKKIRKGETP